MAYKKHPMGALVLAVPAAARKQLLAAFKKAKASRRGAAEALGCSEDTFVKWIKKLGIEEELNLLEKTAMEEGWHHGKGGRPLTARKPRKRKVAAAAT